MYLIVHDHHKVLELGQVDGIGRVLDWLLVVDIGKELALLDITIFVFMKTTLNDGQACLLKLIGSCQYCACTQFS